jgi:hypothetical protein
MGAPPSAVLREEGVKKPLTAEDAKDAEVQKGTRTMKITDIDSLRVLCVLRGEEVLHLAPSPEKYGGFDYQIARLPD